MRDDFKALFEERGYAVLNETIPPEAVDELREEADRLLADSNSRGGARNLLYRSERLARAGAHGLLFMRPLIAILITCLMCGQNVLGGDYRTLEFQGVTYKTYTAEPEEIQLHWKDASGSPYRQFRNLQAALKARGVDLEFAMNAGIFDPGGIPSGLHVEDNRILRPLNLKDAPGNFYLKPNGVFHVTGATAGILESTEYAKALLKPRIALQSGPLLLRNDRIHPKFRATSDSRLHRNGVGIGKEGEVIFAMTKFAAGNVVNLYGFSLLFRHLGCRDALFLDGDLSMMEVNPTGPIPPQNNFGALIAVHKPRPE